MNKKAHDKSVINRQSDAGYSEDHWLKQFENSLQKISVQPRGKEVFDQISSIMNNSKSKYPSVQAAVDDMMQRSGLSDYLNHVKTSETIDQNQSKKTASLNDDNFLKNKKHEGSKFLKEHPEIKKALINIIDAHKGNNNISAIIQKLQSMFDNEVADKGSWEDEDFIKEVSMLNLAAKANNPSNFEDVNNLGKHDNSSASEFDLSNSDAFHALKPAN